MEHHRDHGRSNYFTCYTENCKALPREVSFRCLAGKDFGGTFCKKCFDDEIKSGACPEEQARCHCCKETKFKAEFCLNGEEYNGQSMCLDCYKNYAPHTT